MDPLEGTMKLISILILVVVGFSGLVRAQAVDQNDKIAASELSTINEAISDMDHLVIKAMDAVEMSHENDFPMNKVRTYDYLVSLRDQSKAILLKTDKENNNQINTAYEQIVALRAQALEASKGITSQE